MLTRQAKQAARYREIGEELRKSEGMLLWRRWREADEARAEAEGALRERLIAQAQAEAASRAAGQGAGGGRGCAAAEARGGGDCELPSCSGWCCSAMRWAIRRRRALATIDTLRGRIEQLSRDMEREAGLNRDAGEVIERLDWEMEQLARAHDGHEEKLAEAVEAAREAGAVLGEREAVLAELTEDAARLAARHQSAQRMLADTRAVLDRAEGEAVRGARGGGRGGRGAGGGGRGLRGGRRGAGRRAAARPRRPRRRWRQPRWRGPKRRAARPRRGRRGRRPRARRMRCAPRWRPWRGWWSGRRRPGISCWTSWW